LNAEGVVQITIIALRPQVMPGDGIDKLGGDTNLITDLPDASLRTYRTPSSRPPSGILTALFLYVKRIT